MTTGSTFFISSVWPVPPRPPAAFTPSIIYSKPKQNLLCCHCKGICIPASQTLTQAQAAARCYSDVTSYHISWQGFCSGVDIQIIVSRGQKCEGTGFCLPSKSRLTPISKSWSAKTEKVYMKTSERLGKALFQPLLRAVVVLGQGREIAGSIETCNNSYYWSSYQKQRHTDAHFLHSLLLLPAWKRTQEPVKSRGESLCAACGSFSSQSLCALRGRRWPGDQETRFHLLPVFSGCVPS